VVILPDSSAWIEYLRGTGSATHVRLRALVRDGADLVTTDPVVLELFAGARSNAEQDRIGTLLTACRMRPPLGLVDQLDAAALFRHCRDHGETVRSLADCVIAVVAMDLGAAVLHRDRDFDAIARHTSLAIA
jgi:predicted nucleic acid-binding protein